MEVQKVFRGLGGPGLVVCKKPQSNTISLKSSYAPFLKSFANIISRKYGIWVILSRHMKHYVSKRGLCLHMYYLLLTLNAH